MGHSGLEQLIYSKFGFWLSFSFLHSVALKHKVPKNGGRPTSGEVSAYVRICGIGG